MKEEVLKEYDIFTDGSFDKELEPVAFLLDHEVKTISGAAVVLAGTGQNWMNEPIITVRIQNDERVVASSAFPLELLAIVAGLRIASIRPGLRKIVTDCEAALKLLSSPEKLNYWSNKANVALIKAAIALNEGKGNIEHAHIQRVGYTRQGGHETITGTSLRTELQWGTTAVSLNTNN